jgi:hypothetical protein
MVALPFLEKRGQQYSGKYNDRLIIFPEKVE